MNITVEAAPSVEKLLELEVASWPLWEKEASQFDWSYDAREICYFLTGHVSVSLDDGTTVEVGKGDLVTFPQGMKCVWTVHEPVKKHYRFG
jgi:uncharacterized protein